jgi:transposase
MKIGETIELNEKELGAFLTRVKTTVGGGDFEIIQGLAETVRQLSGELEKKNVSIRRLRDMLFGATTETTRKIFSDDEEPVVPADGGEKKPKRKGHGRNGAKEYTGAKKIRVDHPSLKSGDHCPQCRKGKVYDQRNPRRLVRVTGQGAIAAEVTEYQSLRCNLCGEVFTAQVAEGMEGEKYDATAGSMVALLKYGTGLPFYRLERLQKSLGVPLPAATQWELVVGALRAAAPVYEEFIRRAAQGEVLHNDDTDMTILGFGKKEAAEKGERTGIFTSGVLARVAGRSIALFFTGRKHAGENLLDLLAHRQADLGPPIQMCDALSRNFPEELKTILANCLVHGRRNFIKVAHNFPAECRHVIDCLKDVYRNEAVAKEQGLSPVDRLHFHEEHSQPIMESLHAWLEAQIAEKKVEPNSTLGDPIQYMLDHWPALTLFLREPGAPLDNNVCEQALKMAILHRKNSLFYKTENGARVGDIFMSIIHTCRLSKVNPFEYLTALQRNLERVRANPGEWLPWNYQAAVASADTS